MGRLDFSAAAASMGRRRSGRPRMRRAQARGAERRVSDISLDDAAGFRRGNALGLAMLLQNAINSDNEASAALFPPH